MDSGRAAYAATRNDESMRVRLPRRRGLLLRLELLARLLGTPLQLILQFLLLLLEHLRIRRRAVIGFGKIAERHHEADRLAGTVDTLDHQALALLQLADELA